MDPAVDSTFRVTHPILEPAAWLNWANREMCSWQRNGKSRGPELGGNVANLRFSKKACVETLEGSSAGGS